MADTFRREPKTEDERAVYRAWRRINDAMIAKDRAQLEELFSDERKFVHMSGKTQTKREYLEEIMDGTLNYEHTELSDIEIRVDGDHAALTALSFLTATVYGMHGTYPMRTRAEFTKIGGSWICTG